jgi:hypothetical protein
MDLRLAAGLGAARLLLDFVFFLFAGLRTAVPGHYPIGRAIASSFVTAAAATAAGASVAWLVHPAALLASLVVLYRAPFRWRLGALALGLAVEGAIRLASSIST